MADLQRIAPNLLIPRSNVSTLLDAPYGTQLVEQIGLVRGVTVRSRNLVAAIGGALKAMVGGRVDTFKKLCEDARQEAYNYMVEEAVALGANAIVGVRYESCELGEGLAEVLCYGTAAIVAPLKQ